MLSRGSPMRWMVLVLVACEGAPVADDVDTAAEVMPAPSPRPTTTRTTSGVCEGGTYRFTGADCDAAGGEIVLDIPEGSIIQAAGCQVAGWGNCSFSDTAALRQTGSYVSIGCNPNVDGWVSWFTPSP